MSAPFGWTSVGEEDLDYELAAEADEQEDYENRCELDVDGGVCLRRLRPDGSCPDHG